jgi:hypothetical protein
VHDAVTEVSRVFKILLGRYQFVKTPELLTPAANLVQAVKGARDCSVVTLRVHYPDLRFDNERSEDTERTFDRVLDAIHSLQTKLADKLRCYM